MVAQGFRELDALAEDLSSVPGGHISWLTRGC